MGGRVKDDINIACGVGLLSTSTSGSKLSPRQRGLFFRAPAHNIGPNLAANRKRIEKEQNKTTSTPQGGGQEYSIVAR